MKEKSIIPTYKSESAHSYAAGAYATMELLCAKPEQAETVVLHSAFRDAEHLRRLCREKSIPVQNNDRAFLRINQKEK